MNPIEKEALCCLSRGFNVMPVDANFKYIKRKDETDRGKHPLLAEWKWLQNQMATPDDVAKWWKKWPQADLAIITGKISGITVIDAEKGADLKKYGLDKTSAPTVLTGGGGHHFYFHYTPDVQCCVKKFDPFYDLKNDGGYVLAPPSEHLSGVSYRWLIHHFLLDLIPFPQGVTLDYQKAKGVGKQVDWKAKLTETVGEGSRNDTATSVVGKLLLRFPEREWASNVWPLLVSWNETHAVPPLSEHELKSIFDSIVKTENRRKTAGVTSGEISVMRENGRIVIHTPLTEGFAVFDFSEATYGKGELETVLRTHVEIPDERVRHFSSRLNVQSASGRDLYARQLSSSFGKENKWTLILSEACEAFSDEYRKQTVDKMTHHSAIDGRQPEWLFAPFLEEGSANMIFGKGSTGKSWLAMQLALSLTTGLPFLGLHPAKFPVKSLYVDWENSDRTWKFRLDSLAAANGLSTIPDRMMFYLDSRGAPLYELAESIKLSMQKENITVLIIDSAIPACGGSPEDAVVAAKFFNALREICPTSLIISHEAKADNGSWSFGSVFFTNLSRNIWNLQAEDDEIGIRHVKLHHRKYNNGPLEKSMAYKMLMTNGNEMKLELESIKDLPSEKNSVQNLVEEWVKNRVGSFSSFDLFDSFPQFSRKALGIALTRIKQRGDIIQLGARGKGMWDKKIIESKMPNF